MNRLISQVPYVYEQSEKFAKPPPPTQAGLSNEPMRLSAPSPQITNGGGKRKSGVSEASKDFELLKTAEAFGIKIPPKVRYQMGDPNWRK